MLNVANLWCIPDQIMNFGWEADVWYYDGGRTYFQIAQYSGDSHWQQCAFNIVDQYRDAIIQKGGWSWGWRVFPQGLAVNAWRTGDSKSVTAEELLATRSPYAGQAGGLDVQLVRETAYILEAYVFAERLGAGGIPYLPARPILRSLTWTCCFSHKTKPSTKRLWMACWPKA